MHWTTILPVAKALLKARLFGIKTPLAVSFKLTTRCNLKCSYCGIWDENIHELDTSQIISMLEGFSKMGTQYVSLSGGEPLLRDDLGEIIQFAKSKRLKVGINSNGTAVPDKIAILKFVDDLRFSFDGPREIHDHLRGRGAFDKVMQAVKSCQDHRMKYSMQCVLSKHNLNALDYILDTAQRLHTTVLFQPATESLLWTDGKNNEAPPVQEYREAIVALMGAKKKGAPVRNSMAGLKHIYWWPEKKEIPCSAGLLSCEILPHGRLLSCFRYENIKGEKRDVDLATAFQNVATSPNCKECWCCGVVEFNLMTSFNADAILNYVRNF